MNDRTQLGVNIGTRGLVVKPYWLTLRYLSYKKDAHLDAHVRVFEAMVRTNGKTFECI
jgi:hypothetical protein